MIESNGVAEPKIVDGLVYMKCSNCKRYIASEYFLRKPKKVMEKVIPTLSKKYNRSCRFCIHNVDYPKK